MIIHRRQMAACLAALAFLVPAGALAAGRRFLSVGTGMRDGLYYPIGRAVCHLVNREENARGLRCSAEATTGSIYNLSRLETGELDFAIVQSDIHASAYRGEGNFRSRPATWLRSVLSLHPELVTIIVRATDDISRFEDLKGRRVNTGAQGSGSQDTFGSLVAAAAWTAEDRAKLSTLRPDLAMQALCEGRVDATVLMVGHPSVIVRRHFEVCPTRIIPIRGPVVDSLLAAQSQFRTGAIPMGPYNGEGLVASFGVSATLVTRDAEDEAVVYAVAKSILKGVEDLRVAHPALAGIAAAEMIRASLTAPLHPGAERAYRELGLIP